LVSVVHIPLKATLPCSISGLSWKATQFINPVLLVESGARAHKSNPEESELVVHQEEGE